MNWTRTGMTTRTAATLLAIALLALTAAAPAAAQNDSGYNTQYGESLYRSQCASCHGHFGGGLSAPALDDTAPAQTYDDFDSLVRYTEDTMPPSGPEQMTGSDAEAVAAHLVVNLGNPVSLPDAAEETAGEGTATGTAASAGDGTEEPAGDTGAPGLAAPAALGAVAAALLLRRRR